jgi:hypothetical protein
MKLVEVETHVPFLQKVISMLVDFSSGTRNIVKASLSHVESAWI